MQSTAATDGWSGTERIGMQGREQKAAPLGHLRRRRTCHPEAGASARRCGGPPAPCCARGSPAGRAGAALLEVGDGLHHLEQLRIGRHAIVCQPLLLPLQDGALRAGLQQRRQAGRQRGHRGHGSMGAGGACRRHRTRPGSWRHRVHARAGSARKRGVGPKPAPGPGPRARALTCITSTSAAESRRRRASLPFLTGMASAAQAARGGMWGSGGQQAAAGCGIDPLANSMGSHAPRPLPRPSPPAHSAWSARARCLRPRASPAWQTAAGLQAAAQGGSRWGEALHPECTADDKPLSRQPAPEP